MKRTGDQVRRDLYDPEFPIDTDKGLSRLKDNLLKRHRELKSFVIGSRNDWLQGEIGFQTKQLDTSFYKARRISRKKVLKSLVLQEFEPTGSLLNLSQAETNFMVRRVRNGLERGDSLRAIRRNLLRRSRLTEHQANVILETSLARTSNHVKYLIWQENSDVLDKFIYTAILDSGTTQQCRSLHGTFVDPEESPELMPPLHWNCRSQLVPQFKQKKDISNLRKVDSSRLDKESIGHADQHESLDQWLIRQSSERQIKVLGSERRHSFWRRSKVPASLIVKDSPRTLGWTRLRALGRSLHEQVDPELIRKRNLQSVKLANQLHTGKYNKDLREFYKQNADLALTDLRGTTLAGKRATSRRAGTQSYDPELGVTFDDKYYSPDFDTYNERRDYMLSSKLLKKDDKDWISSFDESLEDHLGINQRAAVLENLRLTIERQRTNPGLASRWENLESVLGLEMKNSVVNVSRIIDRRSRARGQLFLQYDSDPNASPSVQIFGERVSLDSLDKDKLRNIRRLDKLGRNELDVIAAKFYFKMRAPMRAYLVPKPPNFKTWLKRQKKKFKKLRDFNVENPAEFLKREIPTRLQQILYPDIRILEFKGKIARRLARGRARPMVKSAIRSVAHGEGTDYDTLAIQIGKDLFDNVDHRVMIGLSGSTKSWHRHGSKILREMERQKLIRVNSRGITRRSVMDLDTGRPTSDWKDTVSREVEILDPVFKEIRSLKKKIYMADRIGSTRSSSRVHIKLQQKKYYDARGKETQLRLITRDAFDRFPAEQIDNRMKNVLTHVNNVQYQVDNDFVDFMAGIYHYRDQRGKAKYFDSINGFRHEIQRRGDGGFGLVEVVKFHRSHERPVRLNTRIDSRGRIYYNGYWTPTGGEFVRPFIDSYRKYKMTPEGHQLIKNSLSSLTGDAREVLSQAGKDRTFQDMRSRYLELGRIIQEGKGRYREKHYRDFLQNRLVHQVEPEEIPKLARFSLELYRIDEHLKKGMPLSAYETRLMGEIDASASGLQMISLSTGNKRLGEITNLFPSSRKQRIYDLVAQDVLDDPRFVKLQRELGSSLTFSDLSKVAKYQALLTSYGSGRTGLRARAATDIQKLLGERGTIVISRAQVNKFNRQIERKIKFLGNDSLQVKELRNFQEELGELLSASNRKTIRDTMILQAEDIDYDLADLLRRMQENRNPRLPAEALIRISDFILEAQDQYSPMPRNYIDYHKALADKFVRETGKTEISWRTFDGKRFKQIYRPKVQSEIRFYDPHTKRYVKNIYQKVDKSGKLKGAFQVGDVRLGYGVNGTHANDASVVRQFHLWGRRNDVDTATIHDAVFTPITMSEPSRVELLKIYSRFRDDDNLFKNLKLARRQGLSKASYEEFLEQAKRTGLLSDQFRGEEILKKPRRGELHYAWAE